MSHYACSRIDNGWHRHVRIWFFIIQWFKWIVWGHNWSVGWTMGERLIIVSGAVIAALGSVLGTKNEGMKV
jgi:hypothetical protein